MSNKLQLVQKQLSEAKTIKDMVSLPIVQDRFVTNYEKTTGKKDGIQRFQQEVFNFLEMASDKPAVMNCDRFSIFAAIVKAGTTGLSFKDGHLYAIPYGKTLKTSIGAHGKRELLMRMPTIDFVSEAQIVMKGDKFVYDKANSIVLEHPVDVFKQPTLTMENILGAYFRIEFKNGRTIDVLMTNEELMKARAAAKTKQVWDAWPGEMAKKTVYNRGFKLYHRYPEGEYSSFPEYDSDGDDEAFAPPVEVKEEKPKPKSPAPKKEEKPKATDDIAEDVQVVEETPTPKKEDNLEAF